MDRLTQKEQELLDSYGRDQWCSVQGREPEIERFRAYARATLKKDARVSIRISRKDMESLKKQALEEGTPYQTLMYSVLHNYLHGYLVEKKG